MVLLLDKNGLYCPAGDFWIDPWGKVPRAVITHAHADHARPGQGHYLATPLTALIMRHRLGQIQCETLDYGQTLQIGEAQLSFHPAGHVPGSAQVRVAVKGEVWVVSGDYKRQSDGISTPFEPVTCHCFITECTFGLPIFRWPSPEQTAQQINTWWRNCQEKGEVAILGAYALGKAQRVLALLEPENGPILTHSAVEATNSLFRAAGVPLTGTKAVTRDTDRKAAKGALIIAPPASLGSSWTKAFGPRSEAFASGWMAVRGMRRRRGTQGFVVSDHADWPALLSTIRETGAQRILATHGYTQSFARHLNDIGYQAEALETAYLGEDSEDVQNEP